MPPWTCRTLRSVPLLLSLLTIYFNQAWSHPAETEGTIEFSTVAAVENSNHIFNAVTSALRQWGSSLNHNGMSAFIVRVPAGTQFYHGRGDSEPVEGMEWLAFEPEHALMFAIKSRRRRPPPPPPPPVSTAADCDGEQSFSCHEDSSNQHHQALLQRAPPPAATSNPPHPPPGSSAPEPGWLHTYLTKHPLRLLYLDGMSAGKTTNGTLDLQDLILLSRNQSSFPPNGDLLRGQQLCALAATDWAHRIHGFVRMEAGFELILCDFAADLALKHVIRVGSTGREHQVRKRFAQYRAVMDRAGGWGGRRAELDTQRFVSAFAFAFALFGEEGGLPRLLYTTGEQRAALREAVTRLVLSDDGDDGDEERRHDWQATADMIVTRYAERLMYLADGEMVLDGDLQAELEIVLQPFIDFDERNRTAEIWRCTTHFLPESYGSNDALLDSWTPTALDADVGKRRAPSLAALAVTEVSFQICTALSSAWESVSSSDIRGKARGAETARSSLRHLISWLQWPTWKQCRGCGYDEVCAVPVWPWGAREDHDKPSCANAEAIVRKRGYWGGNGR